jgi:transposase, IS30 family
MKKYTHLKQIERDQIYLYWNSGVRNYSEIGRKVEREASTVKREIERNKSMIGIINNNNPKAKRDPDKYHYLPDRAQEKYMERRKESKQKPCLKTIKIFKYVIEELKQGIAPNIIAGRAKLLNIGEISHECIYQFIYSSQGKHLKLWKYLPRAHKRRRKKHDRKQKRTLIPNRIGIEERPKEIEDRSEFGHWEDDSVLGVGKGAALNTKRERKSRYMIITKMLRKTAKNTRIATCKKFKYLHLKAKKSCTADNGSEFTQHEIITQKTGMKYYFATPYHSWERGTNENGNGLIRRFFPKKTDFNMVSHQKIKKVQDWINHRPLKCLNYKTPHEVFHEELKLCQLE